MQNIEQDKRFMRAAINLSSKAVGVTNENPAVGAIITNFIDGQDVIIGKGVTSKTGRPHAEQNALENVITTGYTSDNIKGATLYVTLEPCSHYGRTPPCAEAIIKSGIKRVVIALKDIDSRVCGKGIEMLTNAGITTELGLLQAEAYNVQSTYFINKLYNRSFVTLKLALGKNNVIGSKIISKFSISNNLSKQISHDLRRCYDAILIGVNTAIIDNPMLTCRIDEVENHKLVRIVLDSNLRINLDSNLVKTAKHQELIIICSPVVNIEKKELLKNKGVKIFEIDDIYDIKNILGLLYENNIHSVLVEGGAQIAKSFINSGYVDKFALFNSCATIDKEPIYAPFLNISKNYRKIEEMQLQNNMFTQWIRVEQCLLA